MPTSRWASATSANGSAFGAERPDVDADLTAHLILGALHSEPVLSCLAAGGPEPVAAAMSTLVRSVLDAPSA